MKESVALRGSASVAVRRPLESVGALRLGKCRPEGLERGERGGRC